MFTNQNRFIVQQGLCYLLLVSLLIGFNSAFYSAYRRTSKQVGALLNNYKREVSLLAATMPASQFVSLHALAKLKQSLAQLKIQDKGEYNWGLSPLTGVRKQLDDVLNTVETEHMLYPLTKQLERKLQLSDGAGAGAFTNQRYLVLLAYVALFYPKDFPISAFLPIYQRSWQQLQKHSGRTLTAAAQARELQLLADYISHYHQPQLPRAELNKQLMASVMMQIRSKNLAERFYQILPHLLELMQAPNKPRVIATLHKMYADTLSRGKSRFDYYSQAAWYQSVSPVINQLLFYPKLKKALVGFPRLQQATQLSPHTRRQLTEMLTHWYFTDYQQVWQQLPKPRQLIQSTALGPLGRELDLFADQGLTDFFISVRARSYFSFIQRWRLKGSMPKQLSRSLMAVVDFCDKVIKHKASLTAYKLSLKTLASQLLAVAWGKKAGVWSLAECQQVLTGMPDQLQLIKQVSQIKKRIAGLLYQAQVKAALQRALLYPLKVSWASLMTVARKQANRQWQQQTASVIWLGRLDKAITQRQVINPAQLNKWLDRQSGKLWILLAHILPVQRDAERLRWFDRPFLGEAVAIQADFKQQVVLLSELATQLNPTGSQAKRATLLFYPRAAAGIEAMDINIGRQSLTYTNGPEQWLTLTWELGRVNWAQLGLVTDSGERYNVSITGPFAVWRLIQLAKVTIVNQRVLLLTWTLHRGVHKKHLSIQLQKNQLLSLLLHHWHHLLPYAKRQ